MRIYILRSVPAGDLMPMASPSPASGGCSFCLDQLLLWLNGTLLVVALALLSVSCSSVAELTPATQQGISPAQFPDFNFIASAPDTVIAGQSVPIELYIRQKVAAPVTTIRYKLTYTLSSGSSSGDLILRKDTLRAGDTGSLLYSDLTTYRYVAIFRPTKVKQQQTIAFTCSDNDTRFRQASVTVVIK